MVMVRAESSTSRVDALRMGRSYYWQLWQPRVVLQVELWHYDQVAVLLVWQLRG